MRITVDDQVIIITAVQTTTCPAGTAYWLVEYRRSGDALPCYIAHVGPIYGRPDAIGLLDATHAMDEANLPEGVGGAREVMWACGDGSKRKAYVWHETHRDSLVRRLRMLTAE